MDYRALLALLSQDKPISGGHLAQQLGVTRSAIWKQINRLRALGVSIEAQASRGYRLTWPLELLEKSAILSELPFGIRQRLGSLRVYWEIDSTNSTLLREASTRSGDLHVCLAEIQSAGRGRRGRQWQSPLSGNIYFSLLKRFETGMSTLSGLSLVVGLATIQALSDCGVKNLALKWPNDILADGRKLAGILVELGGEFLGPCYAVIGIGINMRIDQLSGAVIDQPWIDLAQHCKEKLTGRNQLVGRLLYQLLDALDRFNVTGFTGLQNDYARYDFLRGKEVKIDAPQGSFKGIGMGVDMRGALLIRQRDVTHTYDSAEVTVRTV